MLIVHHLQKSQSERIVWLCEELGIPYELKIYQRQPGTMMSPPELQALHPTQAAPVIQDGDVTLGESGAIVEYILTKYGNGKLSISPTSPNYADYLYYLHFGNGYFQPCVLRKGLVSRGNFAPGDLSAMFSKRSFEASLRILEERTSKSQWLAGDEFTAADIMNVFTLTTMRLFVPYSLGGYDSILKYLKRVTERDSYKRARAKADPGFEPVINAER